MVEALEPSEERVRAEAATGELTTTGGEGGTGAGEGDGIGNSFSLCDCTMELVGVEPRSTGRGTAIVAGELSPELGASGLAMVNRPTEYGASNEAMEFLFSARLTGGDSAAGDGPGAGDTVVSIEGGGTRLLASVLCLVCTGGFSGDEGLVAVPERRVLLSTLAVAPLALLQS